MGQVRLESMSFRPRHFSVFGAGGKIMNRHEIKVEKEYIEYLVEKYLVGPVVRHK